MNPDFYRCEIDAINEKWREIQNASDRKGEALAIDYRLHIHPALWKGIRNYFATKLGADQFNLRLNLVFPLDEYLLP